jgi:transcriptional regulator with GAF, ATPase, and Fis domain
VRIQLALIQTRHELYEENLRIHRELDSHVRSKLAIDCLSSELSAGIYPEHIAGTSSAAARLREQIECAARTNGPLLIVGEVGTGKEMAARAIHNRSDRRERPFIKLNCAALARDLLQQELYGVDRAGLRQLCGRMAQKAGKRMPLISSGLRRQAQTYHWPANLIELENCAHRALMFAKNLTLEPDPCLVSPQRLSDVLREHILHVLERTSWHVDGPTGAADILGIRASALRRRMRELGLERRAGTSISQGGDSAR